MTHRRFAMAVYLMALIALCDQLTKWWLLDRVMQTPHIEQINPYFNLVLVWNKGVTFGILSQFGHKIMTYVLIAVALAILVLLGRWLWRTRATLVGIGLGAVMGGAIGNIIDRLRYGAVVDFLDFHYHDYHWYAFNVADAAIVTGVGLLLLDSLVRGR